MRNKIKLNLTSMILIVIINSLLRNIIEIGNIVMFINNVMLNTEIGKEYNNIVRKKVLKKIKENNLFIKQEKYIWKIKEVGFLEIIIEPDKNRKNKV